MGFSSDLFPDPVEDSFTCGVCRDVFDNATNLNACGHTFCKSCVVDVAAADPKCPICRKGFHDKCQSNPNFTVNELIGKMTIRCKHSAVVKEEEDYEPAAKKPRADKSKKAGALKGSTDESRGCDWEGNVSDWYDHATNHCRWEDTACPVSGCPHRCARMDMEEHTKSSIQQHLELQIEAKVEEKVESRLAEIRRGFSAELERFRVQLNTGIPIEPPETVVVTGAGSDEVNGAYTRSKIAQAAATNFGHPFIYVRTDHSEDGEVLYTISPNRMRSGRIYWCICIPDPQQPGTDRDIDFYRTTKEGSAPPPTGWVIESRGQLPLPRLEYKF